MNCNVGGIDRVVRIAAGLVVIAVGIALGSWWGALGLVPLLTGLFRWCPAYVPVKFSTAKR